MPFYCTVPKSKIVMDDAHDGGRGGLTWLVSRRSLGGPSESMGDQERIGCVAGASPMGLGLHRLHQQLGISRSARLFQGFFLINSAAARSLGAGQPPHLRSVLGVSLTSPSPALWPSSTVHRNSTPHI